MTPTQVDELDEDDFLAFLRHMQREATELERAQKQRR